MSDETMPPASKNGNADAEKEEGEMPNPLTETVSPQEESPAPATEGNDDNDDGGAPPPAEPSSQPSASQTPPVEETKQPHRAVVAPLPLEWTKMNECDADQSPADAIRYPWDVMEIDPADTELHAVGTAGQKITRMGSDLSERVSPDLTHLVMRSHLIRTMEGIAGMKHLELLELYDNMVDELRELDGVTGRNLRVLDISYNVIRDMGPVSLCPNLQELYIAQNKIKSIKGLKHLKLLRKIDLGANRIRVMDEDELSGLVNLEELWLGKNKIEKIEGLGKLTKLRRLDVQANRLTSIDNLEAQADTLEELYLAHNAIDVEGATRATGLALPFAVLNTVDLTRNRLADTSPFSRLTTLTDLWISGNEIKTFEDVDHLGGLTELDCVYLEYNPVASEFGYRKTLAGMIPSLTQIDANAIVGPATRGYVPSAGVDLVEKMRLLQDAAIQKAKPAETESRKPDDEAKNDDGTGEREEATAETEEQKTTAETDEQTPASETEEQKSSSKTEENE